MIPTRLICEQLWNREGLSDGLRKHLNAVAELAVRIGAELNEKDYSLNLAEIEAAALLHDIAKGKRHHALLGAEMLESLGYSELAPIVKAHMRLPDDSQPEISELSVVFLADKLFIGSRPVSPGERYAEKLSAFSGRPEIYRIITRQLEQTVNLKKSIETVLGVRDLILLKGGEMDETD